MRTPELYDGYLRDFDGKEQRIGWAIDSSKVRNILEDISRDVGLIAKPTTNEFVKIFDNYSLVKGEIDPQFDIKIVKIHIDIIKSRKRPLFLQFFEGEPNLSATPKKIFLLPNFGTILLDKDFLGSGLEFGNWFGISKSSRDFVPVDITLTNILISYVRP